MPPGTRVVTRAASARSVSSPRPGGQFPDAWPRAARRMRSCSSRPRWWDGHKNHELARELFIGEVTVNNHVSRLVAKLGAAAARCIFSFGRTLRSRASAAARVRWRWSVGGYAGSDEGVLRSPHEGSRHTTASTVLRARTGRARSIAVGTGCHHRHEQAARTGFSTGEYQSVVRLGKEYRGRNPRSVTLG